MLALRAQLRGDDKPVDRPAIGEGGDVVKPAGTAPEAAEPIDREKVLAELREEQGRLETLQGDKPLIMPSVDAQAVASVVADWTGIPVGRMVKNELQAILQLGEALGKRVIGQQHGLDMIARRIRPRAPPSTTRTSDRRVHAVAHFGVGKTENPPGAAEAL